MIADTSAIMDIGKILPQHQSALTLLNSKLQNPTVDCFLWLDLACGKGQIISQLDVNLSVNQRKKLSYIGYDINVEHTRAAEKLADNLELLDFEFLHGDISSFADIVKSDKKFDFITCTNTAHELSPGAFTTLILNLIRRLTDNGILFIYDMELLVEPELGALPWRNSEIKTLLNSIFDELGTAFTVEPNGWRHTSCKGWSVTIHREYIDKSNSEIEFKSKAIQDRIKSEIDTIIDKRLTECNHTLHSFCKYGATNYADKVEKELALYEFWALNRIKEMRT